MLVTLDVVATTNGQTQTKNNTMAETSKYYKFKPATTELLKSVFTYDNINLIGCNIYECFDKTKDMYAWVRADNFGFFDLVEETFSADEVQIEEIAMVDKSINYKVRYDIP
jgi:hypothetical protein